jgi:hypothetical protein
MVLAMLTSLDGVEAMARFAAESAQVVHVIVPRAPGVVEHARQSARQAGAEASVDLRAQTVRITFAPPR